MTNEVIVLPEAKKDLIAIYHYILKHDSTLSADALIDRLEEKFVSLCVTPERGHIVPELKRIHVEGFREIHFKPYRIIYQCISESVYVHAVFDGRRELQEILEQRILR